MAFNTLKPLTRDPDAGWRSWSFLAALLITLQALYLAYFVTPPGDIPDESGHFAYVQDISQGMRLPVLGEAIIPGNLWFNAAPDDPVLQNIRPNYIAQHPPLYYMLAAIPHYVTTKLTDDRWHQIRVTRAVSALSLGLLVLTLFGTLRDVGVHPARALLLASSVSFVPMISHLASGITNDIFLFMLCAMATRWLARFVMHQEIRAAYTCAVLLGLAGGTKMTAWPLILGLLFILVVEMRQPPGKWLKHLVGLSAVALALPAWWALRNVYLHGNPMAIYVVNNFPLMLNYTMVDYLKAQPFFDWMATHSYGLIGFAGYCQTPETLSQCVGVKSTRVAHHGFVFVLWSLAVMAALFLCYTVWHHLRQYSVRTRWESPGSVQSFIASHVQPGPVRSIVLLATAAIGAGLFVWSLLNVHREGEIAWLLNPVFLSASLITFVGAGIAIFDDEPRRRLMYYGMGLFFCYGVLIIYQSNKAYILIAELRGVQGRYFYPFLPLLIMSIGLVLEKLRVPVVLLLWMALGMLWSLFHTYVIQLIPFFEQVRI